MKMKHLVFCIFVLSIFVVSSCNSQVINEEQLLGTWELQDENRKLVMFFQENNIMDYQEDIMSYKAKYNLSEDSILTLGQRTYKITLLNDSVLKMHSLDMFDHRLSFLKIENIIEPIDEFIDILTYYPNGQKRQEGVYHNGFRYGVWKEWYENGQLKSRSYYEKNHHLVEFQEWDIDGKIKD